MSRGRFFRRVWQLNGLIILAVGVAALGGIGLLGFQLLQEVTGERGRFDIVNVEPEAEVEEQWRLSGLTPISGTHHVMLTLHSDQRYAQSYYDKSVSSARNVQFIDGDTNRAHWLFPHNRFLITDSIQLFTTADDTVTRAILYRVVKGDGDGDRRLTRDDPMVIALSTPLGEGYSEILDGVDELVGSHLVDEESLLLVYRRGGATHSARVDLSTFAIIEDRALPVVSGGS